MEAKKFIKDLVYTLILLVLFLVTLAIYAAGITWITVTWGLLISPILIVCDILIDRI